MEDAGSNRFGDPICEGEAPRFLQASQVLHEGLRQDLLRQKAHLKPKGSHSRFKVDSKSVGGVVFVL